MILQILAAILFANLNEWIAHRYILHGLGKRKTNFFYFHWKHHKTARKNLGYDHDYEKLLPLSREAWSLLLLFIVYLPFIYIYPVFVGTLALYAVVYFFVHRYAHLNVAWGEKWIPWHFDHHLGKDQDKNWCVLFPLWDYVFGTRQKR